MDFKNEMSLIENEINAIEEKKELNKNELVLNSTDKQEQELLKTEPVLNIPTTCVESDVREEANHIRTRNFETAGNEYERETRELRLKNLKAQLAKQHKYDMKMLDTDAKYTQMLNKRKKLVEKYSYLYDMSETYDAKDSNGALYKIPKDFSFSPFVNRTRQFGRNISKLNKPLLLTLKWLFIVGGVIGGIYILKLLNIF